MIFTPTEIDGAYLIDIERLPDARGFFARAWCQQEFARHGLVADLSQANIAWSDKRGTLRGLHYQAAPHVEAKLVRCTQGAAYVVAADIRAGSPTLGRWIGVEVTAENRRMLYVPPGCAQGYQTLLDKSELFYQMSTAYVPGMTRGIRYDDPHFQIRWPLPVSAISAADASWLPYISEQPASCAPLGAPS